MHAEHYGRQKVTYKLWRTGQSRCTHAYLISEQGVIKALNHLPIISPFDFHLSHIQNVTIYWLQSVSFDDIFKVYEKKKYYYKP